MWSRACIRLLERPLSMSPAAFVAAGRVPALRVDAGGVVVEFEDRVLGCYSGVVDDFVVRRNDGAFAYNLGR